jgi:serine phosphatase RsbU (regulator of sigma subunit)/anti-sigma regulatory factor (Ser/Thr protein kinase)
MKERGRRAMRWSMRWMVTSATVALITAAVLTVGLVSERNARRTLTREIETRLLLEARNLALTSTGALLSGLPELTLHPLVKEMKTERPELAFVVVQDHHGVVQGHADARRLGQAYELPKGLEPVPTTMRLQPGERLLGNRNLLVVQAPVTLAGGQRAGTATVGMLRTHIDQAIATTRREQLLYLAVLLAIGAAAALVLISTLLRPIGALRAGLERIGHGDLETPIRMRDRTELGQLADAVNDMAGQLKVAQREIVEKERLAREVELARAIQQRLLPAGEHATGEFTLLGAHRAAAEVGGDYFDILPLQDGRVALAIADVAGKGLGGCLVMTMLSALLRALRHAYASPSALLVALETQLLSTLRRGEFVTMFYGVLDPRSGTLVYASAGHTPLLVCRADGRTEWHGTSGIPLGAVLGGALAPTLEDHEIVLGPGDLLVHHTDGISEAFSRSGDEPFGAERIERAAAANSRRGCHAVIQALSREVEEWAGGRALLDDETLLVVGRRAQTAAMPAASDRLAERDPLRMLAAAQRRGVHLGLGARMESLGQLREWIAHCPELAALGHDEAARLEGALYEVCANVIEHGYGGDATQRLDVWWLPADSENGDGSTPRDPDERVQRGCFVVRDHGLPFSPGRWRPLDFADRHVWKRGRGLGLDIIHLTMSEVVYRPGTEQGNFILMSFDPARARPSSKELHHA